ncbi:MAG: hypothetical protein DLM50_08845 [Candidatus Meridianibacter frigidus]|nr:MAG: hypothetical protein DLM50_08845 [Candidatus Eremiobacteraeota bacterium]
MILSSIAFAVLAFAQPVLAGFPPPRTIQTYRTGVGAVVFWDATPYVERFVARGTPSAEALTALKSEAIRLFVSRAMQLSGSERHLRLIVSFARTGAINARYQTRTIEGVQDLLFLDGGLRKKMHFARDWERIASRGIPPAGVRLTVNRDAVDRMSQ